MSRKRPSRLPKWQEWSVYATLGLLIVTGLAWLALDWWVRIEGEFGPEHHPAEHVALIVHGIAAFAFLVVGGSMIPVHVKLGWNLKRNWKSGLWLGLSTIVTALTALGLYYLGEDSLRSAASLAHWVVGLVIIPALLVHAVRGRRGA